MRLQTIKGVRRTHLVSSLEQRALPRIDLLGNPQIVLSRKCFRSGPEFIKTEEDTKISRVRCGSRKYGCCKKETHSPATSARLTRYQCVSAIVGLWINPTRRPFNASIAPAQRIEKRCERYGLKGLSIAEPTVYVPSLASIPLENPVVADAVNVAVVGSC